MTEKVKINLGSGHWKLPGWISVDMDAQSLPEVCADLAKRLPFKSESADLLHSEDFIDQLELNDARAFLQECHRILKPGGVVRILTPDLERLAQLYLNEQGRLKTIWNDHVGVALQTGTAGEIFNIGMRFAGHTFLYDEETFSQLATECGFEVRRTGYQESDIPELCGLDLRSTQDAVSMYFDCYRL